MIAPPKTLAAAAVRPRRMLVTIGFIRGQRDDISSQFSVLSSQFSVLSSQFSVLSSQTGCQLALLRCRFFERAPWRVCRCLRCLMGGLYLLRTENWQLR